MLHENTSAYFVIFLTYDQASLLSAVQRFDQEHVDHLTLEEEGGDFENINSAGIRVSKKFMGTFIEPKNSML